MTRKDFDLIAAVLFAERPSFHKAGEYHDWSSVMDAGEYHRWSSVVVAMADRLVYTNPRFDRKKFLTACGM
jgi:hypothetical protein